jgi:uncharacterized membrane protein SpoIIM required for sporulation
LTHPSLQQQSTSEDEAKLLIEKRLTSWKRLEDLLVKAESRRGLRQLSRQEVRALGPLYHRTAADVAQLRAIRGLLPGGEAQQAAAYLNDLLIRGHAILYRPSGNPWRALLRFYSTQFPPLFRRHLRYPLAALTIFLSISLFSFAATLRDEGFARFCSLSLPMIEQIRSGEAWWVGLQEEGPRAAATIIFHNMRIGLLAFGLSIFPIVGTVRVLLPSALMFGSVQALILRHGMGSPLWTFMVSHLLLEFAAVFIAGGGGLMIGWALIAPGDRSRRDALIERGGPAIQLLAGSLPLFVLAGLIEAYVSPLPIGLGYKLALSASSLIGLFVYLFRPSANASTRLSPR